MIQIIERAGRPNLYVAHGLARACIEIELARTMSMRNLGTDAPVLESLRTQGETSPELRGSIDWTLTRTSPEEEGPLPRSQVRSADGTPSDQGTQDPPPPLNSRAEEKILFLINGLKEEENNVVPHPLSQTTRARKTNGDRKVPKVLEKYHRAWDLAVDQIGADMELATRKRYLDPLELLTVKIDLNRFVIQVPDQTGADWVEARLETLLINYMSGALESAPSFEYQITKQLEEVK